MKPTTDTIPPARYPPARTPEPIQNQPITFGTLQLIMGFAISTAITVASVAGLYYDLKQNQQHSSDVQNARNDVQDANMVNQRNDILSIRADLKDFRASLAGKQDRPPFTPVFNPK